MTDMTRDQLIIFYGISVDDFGRYTAIAEPRLLLTTSFRQAGLAAADERNWSDDDGDYTNAIIDQLTHLRELIFWYDNYSTPELRDEALLDQLNMSRDRIDRHLADGDAYPLYGFIYGYADHATAFSDLMHANDED